MDEVKKLLEEILSSADKRLSPHAENLVKISYKRSLRSTTDPYKRAVFCVLAACDPRDEHSEVATNLDMYLWLKLLQLRERGKKKYRPSLVTLESGIDVGQGINVGLGKFGKKNKYRALNKSRAFAKNDIHKP